MSTEIPRIAFIGIGGLGGYYSFKLAQRDENWRKNITLIGRKDSKHTKKIAEEGLRLESFDGLFNEKIQINTLEELKGTYDFVFICTKAFVLKEIIEDIKKIVHDETIIIPFQNGISSIDVCQKHFGDRVAGGFTRIVALIKEDGIIKFNSNSRTNLSIGALKETNPKYHERIENMKNVFRNTPGISFEDYENIIDGMWDKFVLISAYSTVGCLFRVPTQEFMKIEECRNIFLKVLHEVSNLGFKKGINLKKDIAESVFSFFEKEVLVQTFPMSSSIQRDFLAGKKSELEDTTAYVVNEAKKVGLDVPCYNFIFSAILPLYTQYQNK
eukprot:TRINITY_DN3643_c0_g1_i1.p1 TRINITY_DN3643_c0_g1~~TRINITY_DN3643_c0_g1_i1.p1  ORF type:complete len:334 (-),score=74.25 TRINITY_DN3643_c0_g1_i1:60-1040(-)